MREIDVSHGALWHSAAGLDGTASSLAGQADQIRAWAAAESDPIGGGPLAGLSAIHRHARELIFELLNDQVDAYGTAAENVATMSVNHRQADLDSTYEA
ncbi:hypothetical protein GBF35_06135 [Nonomuraea phyllanthi]|uniref:hypothetical protein n=1 Tax=Nonomuraea phyllanthi TaxID=2219224 RepID=UPI001292E14D|nr:hypothetical protein [Nonomuraea phyllanthi]QFY06312.1 hypothetical protein GBF35_06135 [Nonomuraea phyllanthi]